MKTGKNYNMVFLVDDDETYLSALEHNLKKNLETTFTVKTFKTGEDCLQEISSPPNIVVLDYELNTKNKSAKNGIEILKKIKSLNPDVQVLMLSGQDSLEVAVNCLKNGAHDYIIKNESAFIRTSHLIKNVMYNINLSRVAKKYELWNWIIAVGLLGFVLFDIIYFLNKI